MSLVIGGHSNPVTDNADGSMGEWTVQDVADVENVDRVLDSAIVTLPDTLCAHCCNPVVFHAYECIGKLARVSQALTTWADTVRFEMLEISPLVSADDELSSHVKNLYNSY